MRTLILGGTGMLGHKLWQRWRDRSDVWVTVRRFPSHHPLFDHERVIAGVDVQSVDALVDAVARSRPDVVVDCVGIVKQVEAANDPLTTIGINARFPHRLARICGAVGARLVHISTDCVFSGRTGGYSENSMPDAEDLYGRSKLLGEVDGTGRLTIRTSMIGRELTRRTHGLLEWFLGQRGRAVPGYRHAIFSGFTTDALADVLDMIIHRHAGLEGLYHVAAEPISKLDLLLLLQSAFHVEAIVEPADTPAIDRSLDGRKFQGATGFKPGSWAEMVRDLAADRTPYSEWKTNYEL